MKIIPTPLKGLLVIEPRIATDERGSFFESFNERLLAEHGIADKFVQDNQSISSKNVLRGLHFQKPPFEQGKLVRVVSGRALDVVVDIRRDSETFGKHFSLELSGENNKMMWIPGGFAHGFLSLEDKTVFLYKVTQYYEPSSEGGILYNDPELNIDWKVSDPVISKKDKVLPTFGEFRQQVASKH